MTAQHISVNCYLMGDDTERMFTVSVPTTGNVSILKDRIKEKKASRLKDIDASDLDLWKADFPIDDFPTNLTDGPELRSGVLLSDAFPSKLDLRRIYVIVDYPARSEYYID